MAETVNVHDAKTHFSRLLDKAHAGEEIILSKAGKPYARLMPLAAAPGQRQPGRLKQSGAQLDEAFFEPLPVEELEAWDGHR
jgi:prevent-host-death family protein